MLSVFCPFRHFKDIGICRIKAYFCNQICACNSFVSLGEVVMYADIGIIILAFASNSQNLPHCMPCAYEGRKRVLSVVVTITILKRLAS